MQRTATQRWARVLTQATFAVGLAGVACSSTYLVSPDQNPREDAGQGSPPSQCATDTDCASTSFCQAWHCVQGTCESTNLPSGTNAQNTGSLGLVCQRAVCDGDGGLRTVPDPSVLPSGSAPACSANGCDDAGAPTVVPDPSNTPPETPYTCQKNECAMDGGIFQVPDPQNLPMDIAGDCQQPGCTSDGGPEQLPDDNDTPPATTCMAYTCSNGMAVGMPINPTTVCSPLGFACGTDGTCDTCPAPTQACTDPGPGSRSSSTPYDFQGIGHCDDGGRYFCGAVPTGQADYYTYYDDGTGLLCSFDPYFEIEPSAPATMCAYFTCPSVACPVGSTASMNGAGNPGCCLTAQPGGFTGMSIDFCDGGRVTLQVTTAAACTSYELHFKD